MSGFTEVKEKMKGSIIMTAIATLIAMMQILIIMKATNYFFGNVGGLDDSLMIPQQSNNGMVSVKDSHSDGALKKYYPCFPPRPAMQSQPQRKDENHTIVYLETGYVNLHYEIFYTFIHQICSCLDEKDSQWTINTDTFPHFYVGHPDMLTMGFERVLQEYNTTTCGPIFFGVPSNPHLTIVTTSYPDNFRPDHQLQYHTLLNDPRYIFICHEDAPFLENTTNVFFLTPRHNRYVIPSFFPPSIVQQHSRSIAQQHPKKPPIFLVIGSFENPYRRSVTSLTSCFTMYRHFNFTVRFLGGGSSGMGGASNEKLAEKLRDTFPEDYDTKIELLTRTDTDEFMRHVAESDVILPLVEGQNFFNEEKGYQSGKKLTSSVMWGLGFGKKMVLYRPLAELFGIEEDNATYFLHGESTKDLAAFFEAFGRCLEHIFKETL